MVTTLWHGRTGNNIFQYVFARLIAEHNGLAMATSWPHQSFLATTPHKPGRMIESPLVELRDLYHDDHGQDFFSKKLVNSRVLCNGFFQHPKYYYFRDGDVKGFFKLPVIKKRPNNEVVIHLRLGDYADKGLRSVIEPQWYGRILKGMHYTPAKHKLFIVVEDKKDGYLKNFLSYRPTIISQSPAEDFHFIRQFNTIICSNSSFCWWAAFLSDAEKIYTFSRWIREPHGAVIRLAYMRRARPLNGRWM
jgi:hypothetical protein